MSDVSDAVQKGLQVVAGLPEEAHWLCDRVEPGPGGRIEAVEEDLETRADSTIHAMLLLSFTDQEDSQEWLKRRIGDQLSRCSQCVEEFYACKSRFYQQLLPEHGQANVDQFFQFLSDWDIERVTPVLQDVVNELNSTPSLDQWYINLRRDKHRYNAIYECLCSREMLRSPIILDCLRRICRTGKLEIDGNPAGLVFLLFREEEEFRTLAENAWKTKGKSMTSSIFESTLLEFLEGATREAEEADAHSLSRFFGGLSTIVKHVSKEVIMKCISGARSDAIKFAVQRIQLNCPYWASLLRLFNSLMFKLGNEFWDTVAPLSSSAFPDLVFGDQEYQRLIRSTEQGLNGQQQLLELTEWTSTYIATVSPLNKPTSAQPLIRQLLQSDLPPLSRGICLKEGMKVLNSTLSDVQQELGQVEGEANVMIVRHVNQLINEHLGLVAEIAFSTPHFDEKIMEMHMSIAQDAARDAVATVLRLDLRLFECDFSLMSKKKPEKPLYRMTVRSDLWDAVRTGMRVDDPSFVTRVLSELRPIFNFERLRPGDSDPLLAEKKQFNSALGDIEIKVTGILKRLTAFPQSILESVLTIDHEVDEGQPAREVIISCTLLPSQEVSMASEDILLKVFNADTTRDALRSMCQRDLSAALSPINQIGRLLASPKGLFLMMHRWVKFSMTMVEVLCDRFEGVIRKLDDCSDWHKTLLRVFWEVQWRCLATIFKKCRRWATVVDKNLMIEFCRDSMDHAECLFDNFWAFEQALRGNEPQSDGGWKIKLLHDASKALNPLTAILTIQDAHLLQTCQELICKLVKLMAQEEIDVVEKSFYQNMKNTLYPQSLPGFDPAAPPVTNLTEVQRGELSASISLLRTDFVPAKEKTVIELSDDEYDDIPDEDLLKAEQLITHKPSRPVQTKLAFPPAAPGSRSSTPRPSAAPIKPSALRVGAVRPRTETEDMRKKAAFLEKRKAEKAALEAQKAAIVGNKPKPVQVDASSDDSSSSDEEGSNSLFKLGSRTKVAVPSSKVIPEAPRKAPLRPAAIPTKRAKDNRARIAPDLSPLYKQIFKWDFFHKEEFPPEHSASDYTHVAKSFKSYSAYYKTFEPLLLLEAWQGFLAQKQDVNPSDSLEVKIATRMRADNFVELDTTVSGMHERSRWAESDVILLSSSARPLKNPEASHCIARVHHVHRKWPSAPIAEVSLRCDPPPKMLQEHMRNGGTLHGLKLTSLIPLEREYAAMICLQYYGLRDEIIGGRLNAVPEATESQVKRTRSLYDVNEPQARAILAAISNEGFTLIQGPPGTGKTKTVTGIVGATLTPQGDTIIVPGSHPKSALTITKKKLLVCAPSNAAVDELVLRFKQGIKTTRGEIMKPFVVRVGRSDAINAEVKDVTLEELIEARMSTQRETSANTVVDTDNLRQKHTAMLEERNTKQQALDDARSKKQEPPPSLLPELDKLNSTLREMRRQLDDQRDRRKETSRSAELIRKRIQQQIMDEAHIICATLSGSGHDMLRNVNVDFETVIIDEAAQSVELSALIPLKFGCERCILVGDPQQLPPTVLSRAAAKFSYEKSLFVRIQENNPKAVHLLSIQYRMHPMISAFPSREFYNSSLKDGDGMAEIRKQPWHSSPIFGPYRFFSVAGKESTGGRTSLVNHQEAETALMLYERLTTDFGNIAFAGRIGIVTPYRQQLSELKNRFRALYGDAIFGAIEFNTVDAFQGRERDIIIFSCVRASEDAGIGFLADVRRMNVGLTRAKSSLFVLGNAKYLVRNTLWRSLVEDAMSRNVFTSGDMRDVFGRRRVQPFASPIVAAGQQVAWDPMDIDVEESIAKPAQVNMRNPTLSVANAAGAISRKPPTGPASTVPSGPSLSANKPKRCFKCGEVGHRPKNCPSVSKNNGNLNKNQTPLHSSVNGSDATIIGPAALSQPRSGQDRSREHDHKVSVVQGPASIPVPLQGIKRPADTTDDTVENKKIHLPEGLLPSPVAGPSAGLIAQKIPRSEPPKMVKRKGKTDPFLNRKKKPPPASGPDITMAEAKSRAAANTLARKEPGSK